MTFWTLIRRSLRFHARSHVGVVLGAAIGSAALIGALIVGDSVRETLRQKALQRLANAYFALAPADGFFTRQLKYYNPALSKDPADQARFFVRLPARSFGSSYTNRQSNPYVLAATVLGNPYLSFDPTAMLL